MVPARIDGIVALESNTAIIFRRGPSKLTQLAVWDLESDEVTYGQWIKGRVYTRRSDVSPDGRYLVCHVTNYGSGNKGHPKLAGKHEWLSSGWTAISRPPYFSAIGLWFTGGAWNGGGIWEGNDEVALNNEPHSWIEAEGVRKPVRARKLNLGASEDEPIYSMLLKKRGWVQEEKLVVENTNPGWRERGLKFIEMSKSDGAVAASLDLLMDSIPHYRMKRPGEWRKPFENGCLLRIDRYRTEEWSVCDADGKVVRTWWPKEWHPQFLDVDARGRVVFGERGCLWKWDEFPKGAPRMVADLNANAFAPMPPPAWALEW